MNKTATATEELTKNESLSADTDVTTARFRPDYRDRTALRLAAGGLEGTLRFPRSVSLSDLA
jgi:hypothetical protein